MADSCEKGKRSAEGVGGGVGPLAHLYCNGRASSQAMPEKMNENAVYRLTKLNQQLLK
jgi:hypothetical protein